MFEPWQKKIETRREREGVFSYDLKAELQFQSKTGRPLPDELKPGLNRAFEETTDELYERVARIFDDYEEGPAD